MSWVGPTEPVGFPGGTGVSRLRVYDWPAADGLAGGSPHLHTATAEGYVVLAGVGVLESLSAAGYAETPLATGTLLWFTPGTVHRLVNTSGDLEILVLTQNAGLAEAGDAVLTFPPAVLTDPAAYARAATLPPAPSPQSAGNGAAAQVGCPRAEAARLRRDLAVEGYLLLREQVVATGPAALRPLHAAATRLVRACAADWLDRWRERPLAEAIRTGEQLHELAVGRAGHLADAAVYTAEPMPDPGWGMCGKVQSWDLDGARVAALSPAGWAS